MSVLNNNRVILSAIGLVVFILISGFSIIDDEGSWALDNDDGAGHPLPTYDFAVNLGYGSEVDDYYVDHSQYWEAYFVFDTVGTEWTYGDKAVMAVKFFFSDGSEIADTYGIYGSGSLYASDYVLVPVFEVDGRPYVEPVVCTPDLWPVADDGSILAYPVMAEAVLYTSVHNEDDDNNKE
jgi:hypothetical protein